MLHTLSHHPLMKRLRRPESAALGMLALRVVVGAAFIYHGWPKLFQSDISGLVAFFGNIGIPAPAFMVRFVGFFEVFGGAGLALGLVSRFWAAALVIDMAVAILKAKGLSSWKGMELEMMLLASSLAVFLSGAGKYSVDAKLMERAGQAHEAAVPQQAPQDRPQA